MLNGDAGNDVLSGNAGRDILNGGAGNDDLSGDSGDDIMIGGAGNDTYSITDGGDVVQEAMNGGIDTIFTSVNLTLGANVENAVITGGNTTVTGNDLNNIVTGGGGADSIAGGKGADTLLGQAGNDAVGGGDGNDVIEGGLGADQLNGGAGNDLFLYRLDDPADLANLGGDLIIGFEASKDKIDLVDLFSDFGFNSEDVIGDGFLRIEVVGGNTILSFDSDGGGNGFVTLATLQGVTNLGLSDLLYPSPSII